MAMFNIDKTQSRSSIFIVNLVIQLASIKRRNVTYSSSESVKSILFTTAAGGGLCGNNAGLNKAENLWVNFATSFGTKAIDCFFVLSISMAANVFLGFFRPPDVETVLFVSVMIPLETSVLAPAIDDEKGKRGSFSITES